MVRSTMPSDSTSKWVPPSKRSVEAQEKELQDQIKALEAQLEKARLQEQVRQLETQLQAAQQVEEEEEIIEEEVLDDDEYYEVEYYTSEGSNDVMVFEEILEDDEELVEVIDDDEEYYEEYEVTEELDEMSDTVVETPAPSSASSQQPEPPSHSPPPPRDPFPVQGEVLRVSEPDAPASPPAPEPEPAAPAPAPAPAPPKKTYDPFPVQGEVVAVTTGPAPAPEPKPLRTVGAPPRTTTSSSTTTAPGKQWPPPKTTSSKPSQPKVVIRKNFLLGDKDNKQQPAAAETTTTTSNTDATARPKWVPMSERYPEKFHKSQIEAKNAAKAKKTIKLAPIPFTQRTYPAIQASPEGEETLFEVKLGPKLLKNAQMHKVPTKAGMQDQEIVLLYFGAAWRSGCKAFHSSLIDFYKMTSKVQNLECVYVSADRTLFEFKDIYQRFPFLAMPGGTAEIKNQLTKNYTITDMPVLVVLDGKTGNTISLDGVEEVGTIPPRDKEKANALVADWKTRTSLPPRTAKPRSKGDPSKSKDKESSNSSTNNNDNKAGAPASNEGGPSKTRKVVVRKKAGAQPVDAKTKKGLMFWKKA